MHTLYNKSNLLSFVLGTPGTSTIPNSQDSILVALLVNRTTLPIDMPHMCLLSLLSNAVASCVIFIRLWDLFFSAGLDC
jgi:hypothetical protein